MKSRRCQNGFSILKLVIILLVLGCLELVIYTIHISQQDKKNASGNFSSKQQTIEEQSAAATDVSDAPAIVDVGDLDEAIKVLDQNDPNVSNNDARQLDREASNF